MKASTSTLILIKLISSTTQMSTSDPGTTDHKENSMAIMDMFQNTTWKTTPNVECRPNSS